MKDPIRVVIADDHPGVRAGLRLFVETDESLSVVAEADSGPAAVAAVLRYRPAVLLLDSEMSDAGAAQLIRTVKHACAGVPILALTTFPDDRYARTLLNSGAEGYVSKLDDCETLVRALKAVAAGRSTTGPRFRRRVRSESRQVAAGATAPGRHHGGPVPVSFGSAGAQVEAPRSRARQ